MTSKNPRRAGIYVRLSKETERKEGAGLAVQRQEDDCRAKAAQLGWKIASGVGWADKKPASNGIYNDNDQSAYRGKPRPGYLRMLDDIRSGAIDGVICWHTDRLHRSSNELGKYIELVDPLGVPTESAKAGTLDLATSTGRLVARMLGDIAMYEVEHMSERHKAARSQARAAGKRSGAPAPFGYRKDGPHRMVIHEDEAAAVTRAYAMVIEGHSLGVICRWLEAQGFTSTQPGRKNGGKPFSRTTLRTTLLRASRAGLIEHYGKVVGPAPWPAIVDRATWENARAILTDPRRKTSTGPQTRWLLSGRDSALTCGVCGGTWFCAKKGAQRNRFGYSCWEQHVRRDTERTDELVTEAVIEVLSRPEAAAALRPGIDVGVLSFRRTVIRNQLNALAADDRLDLEQVGIRSVPLREELDTIDGQLSSSLDGSVLDGIAGQRGARAIWLSHSLERQRAIVKATVKVTILPVRSTGHPVGTSWFEPGSVVIEPRW